MRTDGQSLGTGGSSSTAWGVELGFGRAQERKETEGEETDARGPVVSEEREEKARARWRADAWPCRKGKALEREKREKESFQKG